MSTLNKRISRTGYRGMQFLAIGATLTVLAGCVTPNEMEQPAVKPKPVAIDPVVIELAEKAVVEQRFDDAQKILQRVFIANPKHLHAKLLWAEIVLATGSPREAAQRFEQIVDAPEFKGRVLQGKGLTLFRMQKGEEGRKALEQAVKIDPSLWRSWNALGYYHDTRKNWKKAIHAYDRALKENPNSALIHNNRGYSWLLQERFDKSIADLSAAIRIDPALNAARLNLQLALASNGQYARAMLGVAKTRRGDALNNIGYVALLRGDFPAAESFFLRSIETDAAYNVTARRNLSYLKNLKEVQKSESAAKNK